MAFFMIYCSHTLPRLREDITHKMFFCKMCVRETNDTAWNNVRQHERDKWGS